MTDVRAPGRPPGTSARALELIALDLYSTVGFDQTTVEDIAAAAGVSRRTFFRYFESKVAVLWHAFDGEVTALAEALARTDADASVMDAIRDAVVSVNHYGPADVAELRTRMHLISTVPALAASAAPHYDAWEQAIADFAGARAGADVDPLIPLAIGRTTLAACRAAYERWIETADSDLTVHLDAALRALASGFAER